MLVLHLMFLIFCYAGDNSRSNYFEEKGNNENQQEPPRDSLHVSIEPITRARAKRINDAFNRLI